MNNTTFLDVFFSFQDACMWIEHHLEEHPPSEWNILECKIEYINGGWRAGVIFEQL